MSGMMTAPIVGALAGNVLRDFRIEIDYQNGFVYLEQRKDPSNPEISGVGLVLSSGLSVAASRNIEIHPGDKLVAVDGIPMAGKPIAAASEALQGPAGASKRLTLERGGKQIQITAACEKLL